MDTEPAGRSEKDVLDAFAAAMRICPLSASGYRTASHFVCSQPGNARITSEDVMESGRRCVCHLNQRNAKGRRRLFAHPADHRAAKEEGVQDVAESPFPSRKELSAILPKRWIIPGEEAGKRR